jgi:hypothetical protein
MAMTKQMTDQYFDDQISRLKKQRNVVLTVIVIIGIIVIYLT